MSLPPIRAEAPLVVQHVQYRVLLDSNQAFSLQVFRGKKRIAETIKRAWHPWKLVLGDVDGCGQQEIIVGLNKKSRNLKMLHTTLHVYGFNGREFSDKWLGSSMGRPLVDFCCGPRKAKGAQALFTLQRTIDGHVALDRYYWCGFGFQKEPHELLWKSAKGLRLRNGKISLIADGRRLSIDPKNWK